MNLEVYEADFWGAGFAFVGEFVAVNCQTNTVRFYFGELDVADEVGIGYFLSLGVLCLETKKMVSVPSTRLDG